MPKLSTASLEKRFVCPHCSQTFRTRQGLSGHIQFKHHSGSEFNIVSPYLRNDKSPRKAGFSVDEIHPTVMKWLKAGRLIGHSRAEANSRVKILEGWPEAVALCKTIGVDLDADDFKNYLVASLGCAFVVDNFREELIKESNPRQKVADGASDKEFLKAFKEYMDKTGKENSGSPPADRH